ncbi:hypothetical protein B0H15DRAFT_849116 [Mycena belliarum]|uniref:DASH complex subunit DUO1 n=1 Tax=Mycena belliarum TaxID=1033014 RepID=A0AAD6TZ89_9AGAR|nr:hypothetical protein B0H15DRAFT_849116 [Mycena belliae]
MSQDSILFTSTDSRLLSESPFLPSSFGSSSHTGPGGIDLSISELSLSDKPPEVAADDDGALLQDSEEPERINKQSGKLRHEKLQDDLFILRKLNTSLAGYNEALSDIGTQNERIAAQLEQTEALLNKYVGILSGSEQVARLIFDEQWQGGDNDERIIVQEQIESEERARALKLERAAAAQREKERLEQEAQERINQTEREQAEKDRKERAASRGGVRGVRGTRASMRASSRGTSRGAISSSGRASATTAPTASSSGTRGTSHTRLGRRTS